MTRIFHFLNVLSIDVAIGAVCSALFFAQLFHVKILSYGLISLGLTVWLIYCADHLLDARHINYPASTQRHRFYQDNHRWLIIVAITVALVDVAMVFLIRRPVFVGGIFISAAVLLYLIINRIMPVPKEIIIAILYTGGVLLPSVAVTSLDKSEWPWIVIAQFFLTVLINLALFSWFDRENDEKDRTRSLAIFLGPRNSKILITVLFALTALLLFFSENQRASYLIVLMDLILLMIYIFPAYFAKDDRYRLVGDAAFLFPVLILF